MKTIDDYIQQAANMENTSDGGSPAYHFGDVVLVKYQGLTKYGQPREGAELIAQRANEKNSKGVNTPAHLGIKRVIDGEKEICWVLQERAKGKSFSVYCSNQDSKVQLDMQSRLASASDAHYEKLVIDVCELFNLGLELKPKNMFYNESLQDGGFTIIDLLAVSGESFNSNSLKDVLYLCGMLQGIYNCSCISPYDKNANESDKDISKQQHFKIRQKIFSAMEKTIPNFDQHRRWVLRSMPNDVLEFFSKNGTYVGNLALSEQEYEQFNRTIKNIMDNSIQKIESGKNEYWQIGANEIRIDLDQWGMQDAWRNHEANNKNQNEFSGEFMEYEYRRACVKDLETSLNQMFDEQLAILSTGSTNPLVLKAKNSLDKKRADQEKGPKHL